jgi:hypothetical protein
VARGREEESPVARSKLSGEVPEEVGALHFVQGKQAPTKGGGRQGELESNPSRLRMNYHNP